MIMFDKCGETIEKQILKSELSRVSYNWKVIVEAPGTLILS